MFQSRRKFLKTAAASGTLAAVSATPAVAKQGHLKPDQIVARFAELHGDKAFKILAPAAAGNKPFAAQLDSGRTLFFASAIKTFGRRRFTVFVRRGFAATCAHLDAPRAHENRRMNAR